MDKIQAGKLIRDTFENPFDEEQFRNFVINLLNGLDESKAFSLAGQMVPEAFRGHVHSYKRLGTYTAPDGQKLDVLAVKLSSVSALERARTMQRNFTADYLKNRDRKEAALVAFYYPESSDWRFSYVKMNYSFDAELMKLKEELTPAKRYSFLVGGVEPSHTAQKQIVPLLQNESVYSLTELENAFNIETVTKEFFEKYSDLFLLLKDELDSILHKDKKAAVEFARNNILTVNFAKKLLGQIVFLYFLQKKGWMGVEMGTDNILKPWGSGPKDFLRKLFRKEIMSYDNFFDEVLEPLFYEALALEHENGYFSKLKCRIPFLNGGLFEPINNYNWQETEIRIDNSVFKKIFDTFDLYNFTVKEDEPLEKEVAVDPEMLGKVFENLLEVKDRKSKGAFYTPREIVHYMCQESLINYLNTKLDNVSKEEIEELVRHGDRYADYEHARQKKGGGLYEKPKLPQAIVTNSTKIDSLLRDIKVCDPAIGSGAFPVGMMNEIVRARYAVSTYNGDTEDKTLYDFKRQCIQDSLYGVDIDSAAVDIAKLRLWLSLVVDEEDFSSIKPLPNLDYKIMQGNTLIEEYEGIKLFNDDFIFSKDRLEMIITELETHKTNIHTEMGKLLSENQLTVEKKSVYDEELKEIDRQIKANRTRKRKKTESVDLFKTEARNKQIELNKCHKEFFSITSSMHKKRLREQITRLEWALIEATLKENEKLDLLDKLEGVKNSNEKPFFLWMLNFAEVFKSNGGFDIVIGNPPYLQIQKLPEADKNALAAHDYKTFSRSADLYCLFYEKGASLLANSGVLSLITSNKFFRAGYGKALRNMLNHEYQIVQVVDFCELPVFEAGTDPAIIMIGKNKRPDFKVAVIKEKEELLDVHNAVKNKSFHMTSSDLLDSGWAFVRPNVLELLNNVRATGIPLKNVVNGKFYRGILTGFNEAFIIDESTRNQLIAEDPKSAEIIKPWLNGADIKRWCPDWKHTYLIFTRNGICIDSYPAIKKHLEQFVEQLTPKKDNVQIGRKPGKYKWYEIQDRINYYKGFDCKKIVYNETSKELHAFIDSKSFYINKTGFIIIADEPEYVLAILNSKLMDYYYRHEFPSWGDPWNGGRIQFRGDRMEQVPIAKTTGSQKKNFRRLINLVQKYYNTGDSIYISPILKTSVNISFFEQWLNALVYELYFPADLHERGCYIFRETERLLEKIPERENDENSIEMIELYENANDINGQLRAMLFSLQSIAVIRTVEVDHEN